MKYSPLTLFAATALLAGCAPFRYSQFTGHQPWPTAAGTMADSSYAVPVYRGWPQRPYTVIGSIQFANPDAYWDDGDTARAARLAKSKNADAIIMRVGAEAGVRSIAGAAADPRVLSIGQVAALVIKWKPESEIAAEKAALERFASDFRGKHPGLSLSEPILEWAAEWVDSEGLSLDSATATTNLENVLSEVLTSSGDGKSRKWLFKGSLRSNALTSSYSQVILGVATVTQNGDVISIVSAPGRASVHLSATVKEGRLSGQMGASSGHAIYSGKTEGVFSPDQISVSGQAQTAEGLLQATFQFIH